MNNRFYRISAVIATVFIAAVIFFIVVAKKKDNTIAKIEKQSEPVVMSSTNLIEDESKKDSEEFNEIPNSSKTDNNSNSVKKDTNTNNTTVGKNSANKVNSNAKNSENNTSKEKASKTEDTNEKAEVKDPVFKYPVQGEIMTNYAKEKLTYSDTLGEWVTHLGIDIKAAKTTVVVASADGKVKSIKNDPRYGLTVVVEHVNGFSTVYSNLLTAEFVSVGENVKEGQTLGTVGNTASFEILNEPHLHFEIMKDGSQIDPNMYLKK